MDFKESYYNYHVTSKDDVLIYNFLNSTCVIMNKVEFEDFKKQKLNEEYNDTLKCLGIYVPIDTNELDYHLSLKRIACENDKLAFFRIYTTYNCNAHCFYCYENGVKKSNMDYDHIKKTIQFVKDNSIDSDKIVIEWFGGEPLINQKVIDEISTEIIKFSDENNIIYESRMISNGFLFDDYIIKKAKNDWNLKFIQITLDGLKETYEKTKKFNVENSFERVLDNIENILKNKIHVNIRINYSSNNIDEILELIDLLTSRFKKFDNFNIYSKEIMDEKNEDNIYVNVENNIRVFKKFYDLNLIPDILNTMPVRNYQCVANKVNAYMIDPDGNIGKCSQALAKKDFVGNIEDGLNISDLSKWLTTRLENDSVDCNKCKFLPICNGGCIYERLQNKKFCFANEKLIKYKLTLYLEDYQKKEIKNDSDKI